MALRCIGNSGPHTGGVRQAVEEKGPGESARCSRGTATSRGGSTRDVKANYLASPPLVVAYALAGGRMDLDLTSEPLGVGCDGEPVYLATSGLTRRR